MRRSLVAVLFVFGLVSTASANFFFARSGTSTPPTADVFVSPAGSDSWDGTSPTFVSGTIGPVLTPDHARALIAAKIAADRSSGTYHSYTVMFEDGVYPLTQTLVMTTDDTPGPLVSAYAPAPETVTYENYPGVSPIFDAGADISGTFSDFTLPGGGAGCVSSALVSHAPMTGANASYYVGDMWVNGLRASEPFNPRKGDQWFQVPGSAGTVEGTLDTSVYAVATFTNGTAAIAVSDLSMVPLVGETMGFYSAAAGFSANRQYWILTKSGVSGSGTVTLSGTPGGSVMTPNASTTDQIMGPVESMNWGDRANTGAFNSFPINSGNISATPGGPAESSTVTDLKIEFAGQGNAMMPVESISGTTVKLNSRAFDPDPLYAKASFRVVGDYGHMGDSGFTGEVYTDRTSGKIYYSLRSGEACNTIQAVVPFVSQLLRVSNSVADSTYNAATDGHNATTGKFAGNIIFKGISFEHTQSEIWTGRWSVCGATGGVIGDESSHYASCDLPAVATIGASNVTFDSINLLHLGGAMINVAYGSNHVTIQNSTGEDAGSSALTAGACSSVPATSLCGSNSYLYTSDAGYNGTTNFGSSVTTSSLADPVNCCQTFFNDTFEDWGRTDVSVSGYAVQTAANFSVTYNTFLYGPAFGTAIGSDEGADLTVIASGVYGPGDFGSTFEHNEVGFCGYETTTTGVHYPGSSMMQDFGCFYERGAHDGNGTQARLQIDHNFVHDISAGAWQSVNGSGSVLSQGHDAKVDYEDGNDSNGEDEFDNRFFEALSVGSLPQYPTVLSSHTGGLRTSTRNNVFVGVWPSGSTWGSTLIPWETVAATDTNHNVPLLWKTGEALTCSSGFNGPCYVMTTAGNLYSATAGGTTGGTAPTCASGTCSDGGITWTYNSTMASYPAVYASNIMEWQVSGSSTATGPEGENNTVFGAVANFWQYQYNYDSFFQAGASITDYSPGISFTGWQGSPELEETGSTSAFNVDPNFVDFTTGNVNFNATGTGSSCGAGLGVSPACGLATPFAPWNYNDYGAPQKGS